ncbi:MAG: hypothetical protein HQM16_00410 [Deltaproteobacteria bacterium]|nr:hypothetical protein [Deltaproteobacteria bacterium]
MTLLAEQAEQSDTMIKQRILLFALLFSMTLAGVLGHLIWKDLLGRENKGYAVKMIRGMYALVNNVDQVVHRHITPELYKDILHQPLSKTSFKDSQVFNNLRKELKKIDGLHNFYIGFYTDCSDEEPGSCYFDDYPGGQVVRRYEPESRPWYLATHSHTDWVLINFMRLKETLSTDYPPKWGWVLSKKIVYDEQDDPADSPRDKGLWINLYIPFEQKENLEQDFNEYHGSILELALSKDYPYFFFFELFFKTVLFPKKAISDPGSLTILCHQNNEYELFSSLYRSFVSCQVNKETIHFNFSKKYDHSWHRLFLVFIGLVFVFVTYFFFRYIQGLQMQSINNRLEIEKAKTANLIGSKLIHDLKKGIMAPLNQLPQIYEHNFESEALQRDFKERLKANFKQHFKYLSLLSKYTQLLTNNLKRTREKRWVKLDQTIMVQYLDWILGRHEVDIIPVNDEDIVLRMEIESTEKIQAGLYLSVNFPDMYIPEISFYRILKNIWENYNAYGKGSLVIECEKQNHMMIVRATNQIKEQTEHTASATNLGLTIINQLLEDNFGAERVNASVKKDDDLYLINIVFPILEVPPE